MKRYYIPAIIILTITLTACSVTSTAPQANPQPASVSTAIPTPTDNPAILPTLFPDMNVNANKDMTRLDEQGMVVVEITPLNLGAPAETLNFDVVLNTHSVDLSMDLAALATLTTDTGASVQAVSWDAPRGGHHVSGILIFPSIQEGKSFIEGASKLTLTILDLDTPVRTFEWELR